MEMARTYHSWATAEASEFPILFHSQEVLVTSVAA